MSEEIGIQTMNANPRIIRSNRSLCSSVAALLALLCVMSVTAVRADEVCLPSGIFRLRPWAKP